MALIERIHAMGTEVLISAPSGAVMNTEQVAELALLLEKRNSDIVKIVTRATSNNLFEMPDLQTTRSIVDYIQKTL